MLAVTKSVNLSPTLLCYSSRTVLPSQILWRTALGPSVPPSSPQPLVYTPGRILTDRCSTVRKDDSGSKETSMHGNEDRRQKGGRVILPSILGTLRASSSLDSGATRGEILIRCEWCLSSSDRLVHLSPVT